MNVLITGTSTGLGNGLAQYYLKAGWQVYGISRKTSTDLEAHPQFHFLAHDLSSLEATADKLAAFVELVDTFDLVILNAGILNEIKDLHNTRLEEIKHVMDVNVWGNKVLIDVLTEQVNHLKQVVAISSGASVSGARGWNAYSLSKATLNMLINLYSKEFPETHFCALAPGLIDTGMQDYLYNLKEEEKFPVLKKLKKAKGTSQMPRSKEAARIVATAIEQVRSFESGSFQDVRKI
ncbi:SDR family NAD(P)-dependent oxidoreductase [Sunxiuqinia sp. sy24]|uniref:SDR family NAD(P)-dependent oxidoreductase n=1 Tax=Sunxiuqinia sp. sy24 TaxID=3461495 RepID=UPI0040461CC2